MMRQTLLAVRGDQFDVLSVRDETEAIARAFGEYLARTGAGGSSKHKALGPVGKALQHARAVRGEALLGYARRVHEQVTGTVYATGAVEMLDEGLRMLDALLGKVPARAHSEILRRIDYATYYDVRRRGVEFFQGWEAFVRAHGPRLGIEVDPTTPRFKAANAGQLGEPYKKAAEEYLAQVRLAPSVAADADDEED